MKTSALTFPAFIAATLFAAGCYSPQPTTLWRQNDLPSKHWYELSDDDGRIKVLAPALQNSRRTPQIRRQQRSQTRPQKWQRC